MECVSSELLEPTVEGPWTAIQDQTLSPWSPHCSLRSSPGITSRAEVRGWAGQLLGGQNPLSRLCAGSQPVGRWKESPADLDQPQGLIWGSIPQPKILPEPKPRVGSLPD